MANGIIAEFNPFHLGHQYLLREGKKRNGAAYTLVVMSGHFLQRGEPAIADKFTRARMALLGGADLVLELPCLYATASAEHFARGAVSMMDALGTVDTLVFGSEEGDLARLLQGAEKLKRLPPQAEAHIRSLLAQGHSYPKARAMALEEDSGGLLDAEFLASPNNILAMEYLKALPPSMKALTIARLGGGYHSEKLQEGMPSSATAIRRSLRQDGGQKLWQQAMPRAVWQIWQDSWTWLPPMGTEDFGPALLSVLLSQDADSLSGFFDLSLPMARRILRLLPEYRGVEDYLDRLKNKSLTHSRLRRALLHAMLGITRELAHTHIYSHPPYARVLGLRHSAKGLLAKIKKQSSIPLVTNPARARKELPARALPLLELDLRAGQLYMLCQNAKAASLGLTPSGGKVYHEWNQPVVVLEE